MISINFPWRKPTFQEQMMQQMKTNLANQITSDFSSQFLYGACNSIVSGAATTLVTILGWKKVPLVKVDPTAEREEQDAIYNDFMARVNGDRDAVHGVPDPIEIKAFQGDTMDPNERDHLYETIDIINEALDIERTGQYRTEETMEEENRATEEKAGYKHIDYSSFRINNVLGSLLQMFTPFFQEVSQFAVSLMAMMVCCKMLSLVDKIKF